MKLTNQQLAEAIALYKHLMYHTEVQEDEQYPGVPMCKICGKAPDTMVIEELMR